MAQNRQPKARAQWQNNQPVVFSLMLTAIFALLLFAAVEQTAQAQENTPTSRGFSLPVIQPYAIDDPNAFVYKVRLGEYWILIARKFGVNYDELRAANPELWTLRGELIWPGDEMRIPGLTAADQRATEEYTVQPGDSWRRIADQFGVSYWDLRLDNLGLWRRRGTVIQPGDQMQVVTPGPVAVVGETPPATEDGATTEPTAAQPADPAPTAVPEVDVTPTPAPLPAPGALPPVDSAPPFLVTNPPADGTTYDVRPGDNWFAIANRYGITFEKLRSANPELWALRGQNIRPADQMVIPAHGSPPPPMDIRTLPDDKDASEATDGSYTVVEGDTWTSVAAQFDVTVEALKAANLDLSSRELALGDILRIP